jgi:quercetin dioxygenase-like cupin family protein
MCDNSGRDSTKPPSVSMKSHLVAFLGISGILTAAQTANITSVPVEDEPLHKVMFKNESVTVIHVTLAPGQTTLYHSHTHDRVAVDLSTTSIAQQKINEAEGRATPTKPGNVSALTLTEASYTHRVHNVGTAPYEVLDIEPARRPETPSPDAAATVAAENPSARVYSWVLAPGATTPMHTHMRPYVIVSVTPINLKMSSPDGQSATHEVGTGDFRWVDARVTHNLSNAGSNPGQIIEVELK